MLFLGLGLGTGLGSAMIVDGVLEPMELAHMPFRNATFEDYVGERGLKGTGQALPRGRSSVAIPGRNPGPIISLRTGISLLFPGRLA